MDKLIAKLESISLSGEDILSLVHHKANILSYDKLKDYKSIHNIMKNGACVILYLSEKHYGHWCVVFYRNDDDKSKTGKKSKFIEFFDPYGVMIDDEKNWVHPLDQKRLGVEKNYMTRLLAESNCKIEYNHYKFQKLKPGMNTCGRWVATRLNFRYLPLDDFHHLFKKDGDKLVVLMTMYINI